MLQALSHVMLFVNDLDRAVAWYEQQLGFGRRFVAPDAYASLWLDGMQLRLDLHPSEADAKDVGFGPMPFFAVTDIDSVLAQLAAAGVKVSEPKSEGGSPRFATIWDSEGNALGLEEARAAS